MTDRQAKALTLQLLATKRVLCRNVRINSEMDYRNGRVIHTLRGTTFTALVPGEVFESTGVDWKVQSVEATVAIDTPWRMFYTVDAILAKEWDYRSAELVWFPTRRNFEDSTLFQTV